MNGPMLQSVDVTNFRSIRGHVHAPLDARVVLIHGENGAGKTSLLAAIELALTGAVASLRRADPGYATQLLHRSATSGEVSVAVAADRGDRRHGTTLTAAGISPGAILPRELAAFFGERSYLPQSLLNQLLQIYQESGSGANSPLARFVGHLLGIDRLDAIETGLAPLQDVRNLRKVVDRWQAVELERDRADRMAQGDRTTLAVVDEAIGGARKALSTALATLDLAAGPNEDPDVTEARIAALPNDDGLDDLTDRRRQLGSIRREIESATGTSMAAASSTTAAEATAAQRRWEAANGEAIERARRCVAELLPDLVLPPEIARFADAAARALASLNARSSVAAERARKDATRLAEAEAELDAEKIRLRAVEEEIQQLPSRAGGLASALAEISAYIEGETCPVCERDYAEVNREPLAEHVHARVRSLSASADRLLALGRARGEATAARERLAGEIDGLRARAVGGEELAKLDRQAVDSQATLEELAAMASIMAEGDRLRAAEVAALRADADRERHEASLAASRQTIAAFASSAGLTLEDSVEPLPAIDAIERALAGRADRLLRRLTARREALEALAAIRAGARRRAEVETAIADQVAIATKAKDALRSAEGLRMQGRTLRDTVDRVRSAIIRREFNDRLNRLWRDLFVRLAPGEPFVPAFRVPVAATRGLQPTLVTTHRDGGDAGGTPGAMLSAGNLNTAALTLFIALHLSVPRKLPWLILDDPVQSMDDVHVAQFAALLRTLSKQHGRQVVVAVHDRQLFDYLRLELSPAFQGDSLLTLELTRGPRRDTRCLSQRFSFQEEELLAAA